LRDPRQAEELDVEAQGLVLATARHHQLHVVDPHRPLLYHAATVGQGHGQGHDTLTPRSLAHAARSPMLRRMSRVLAISTFLLLASACEPTPEGLDATLADGTRVVVTEDGRVALLEGERALWSTPSGAFPTARTFGERVSGALAIWSFRRTGETAQVFDRYRGAREQDG